MKKTKLHFEHEIDDVSYWLDLFASDPSLNTSSVTLSPADYVIRNSKLENCWFEYFDNVVPTLLEEINNNGILKFSTNVEELKKTICLKLESFICGGVREGIKGLAESYSKPQKFCGKVFNVGDLTYTCKTCAQDPTCVFCHFCFHQSIHKNHRYKLHTSNGTGGYCDCGDEEAWTTGPACDYHKDGMDNDESWNPFLTLPQDVQCRATFMFLFLIQYCMELLVMEEHDDVNNINIPIDTSNHVSSNSHIVMLYNDESHSYEDVITTLIEAIGCSRQQAFQFAAVVDKEGRSSIYYGPEEPSIKVVEDCTRLTQKHERAPLKSKSMHHNVVAHQMIALDLMTWMTEIIDMSDGLRRLLCLLTTSKISGVHRKWDMPFLEEMIMKDTSLWKVARARSHQFFMNNILMDTYGRKEFAVTFAKCYKVLTDDFLADDHEHDISVAALSVQIFTVPSLATMLILEGNILRTCLEVFLEKIKPGRGKTGCLDFQDDIVGHIASHRISAVKISRTNFILNDVLYLLRQKPVWTPQLSTNFLEAFDIFVDILKLMQGMDPVVRKVDDHIAYEPNWEIGFTLQLAMMRVVRLMLTWCCSNVDILKSATHRCVFALRSLQPLKYTTIKKKIVVNHDVTTKSTSIHFALSRFLAGLAAGSSKFGISLHELLDIDINPDEMMTKLQLQILEYPLRSLVLSAQVKAQMWKRNGYAIHNQVSYYHNNRVVSEMADRDVLMLQVLACIMDQDHFVKALLHKYNLLKWSKGKHAEEKDKDKEATEKENIIAREFLLLIFHILSERYISGVSALTTSQILEREVIHRLCLGPLARSTLIKNLPFSDSDEEEDLQFEAIIDGILKKVATYKEPGVTGKGVFELKEDEMVKCNRYFMHYTKCEKSKMVEEERRISKKHAKEPTAYLYPPPKFQNNFQNIARLLCCDSLLKVLRNVLARAVKDDHGSEEHIEIVLMIIAVGLLEVKRGEEALPDFDFVRVLTKEEGNKKSISSLLDELIIGNDSKEYYLMGKWLKQLLQEEVEHTGNDQMDVDSDVVEPLKDDETEKAEKARIASERKKKMIEQFNRMQKSFIDNNMDKKLFDIADTESEDNTDENMDEDLSYPVAIGGKHSAIDNACMSVLCILCQEEEPIDGENFFVVTSFIHKSRLMKETTQKERENLMPEFNKESMVNISSCGHIVHIRCWEKYFTFEKDHESRAYSQRRPPRSSIDHSQSEYLCPLCNSFCNSVLPLLPRATFNNECSNDNSQDMSLPEFLAYLDRFSVEMVCNSKSDNVASPASPSPLVSTSWDAEFTSLLTSYAKSYSGSSDDNFMELFAKKLMKVFSKELENKSVSYSAPYSWMACSFTLQAYECSTRIEGNNMFSSFSERQDKFWYALIQYLSNNSIMAVYEPIQNFGNVLFNFFCGVDCGTSISILEADIFGILVSLRFLVCCIQSIFQEKEPKLMNTPTCLIDDIVFKICLLASLVKIYLTAPLFGTNDETSIDDGVVKSWLYVQNLAKINHISHVDSHKLKHHVIESLLPFMRCSAIFFHYLTGVKFPDNLTAGVADDEMRTLQKYLNLPEDIDCVLSLETWTSEPLVSQMVERWCRHKDVIHQIESVVPFCYVQARTLIQLPREYSTLVNRVSGFMCPTLVNDASRIPALCLVCDTILCSQCYCCVTGEVEGTRGYGACSKHSMECGSGIGIFLRIRDCEILLMHNKNKGLFLPSPYLDEYGETDLGLFRGNPLYLNEGRYKNLQQLWLRQRIPEAIAQSLKSKQTTLLPSASVIQHWDQM